MDTYTIIYITNRNGGLPSKERTETSRIMNKK